MEHLVLTFWRVWLFQNTQLRFLNGSILIIYVPYKMNSKSEKINSSPFKNYILSICISKYWEKSLHWESWKNYEIINFEHNEIFNLSCILFTAFQNFINKVLFGIRTKFCFQKSKFEKCWTILKTCLINYLSNSILDFKNNFFICCVKIFKTRV